MLLGPYTAKPLMVALGYLWPAYQSYKCVATSKPKMVEYWCQYWVLLGFFLSLEWLADGAIFWIPLYHEAKLLIILYLWHPRTQGASLVFTKLLSPWLVQHEAGIDRVLAEAQARLTDSVTRHVVRAKELAADNATSVLEDLRNFSKGSNSAPNLTMSSMRRR